MYWYGDADGPTHNWVNVKRVNHPATTSGSLALTYAANSKSGTFNYTGGGYSTYAVVLKASAGFSAYLIGSNTSGSWTTANLLNNGGQIPALSHLTIYGVNVPTTVPVPAALPLALSGMIILGAVARRRRKS